MVMTDSDVRTELQQLIDRMDREQLLQLLDEACWLFEELTEDEMAAVREGEAEIARGDSVSRDEYIRTQQ